MLCVAVGGATPASRPTPRPETRPGATRPAGETWDRSPDARQRGVETYGGTPLTEGAVEAGLSWLAAHQLPDGTWSCAHFDRMCPPSDRCSGRGKQRLEQDLSPGLTGLALLAFLGAGYTDRQGPHQDGVRRAVDALLRMQQDHGGFGNDDAAAGYNDSLATLALAEYGALTRDMRIGGPLRRAVRRLASSQQPLGGWDYRPTPTTGRNDTSITAWMVQALHAAAAAGVAVPPEVLVRAALHFSRAAGADGRVWYADAGEGYTLDDNLRPAYQFPLAMTAAGLMCEQLLGWRPEEALPAQQRDVLRGELPAEAKLRLPGAAQFHSDYYWYYGTLAMFQRGGDDWTRWNAALRDTLLPLQCREKDNAGRKKHEFGSWPPYGPNWGRAGLVGGRVYSTALCTLTLEVYYRHTPAFLTSEAAYGPEHGRAQLAAGDARQRREVLACLKQLRVEFCEPVLVELLNDGDPRLAREAAETLARLDSPAGIATLESLMPTLPALEQRSAQRALARARAVRDLPPAAGRVRMYDAEQGLATLDLARSYVGMSVVVEREGRTLARMRVIQRFSGRTVVVAEVTEPVVPEPPQPGDAAVGR